MMTREALAPASGSWDLIEFRPDSPAIIRIVNPARAVPRFGDDIWSLDALVNNPTGITCTLHFERCPATFRAAVKRLMFREINDPLDLQALGRRTNGKEFLAASTLQRVFLDSIVPFTELLAERGIERFCDVRDEDFIAFDRRLSERRGDLSRISGCRFTLTRLSLRASSVPEQYRLPLPPWERRANVRMAPRGERNGLPNRVPRIDQATMRMLLVWALRFVEDLSPDIERAAEMRAAMASRLRMSGEPSGRARAIEGLEHLRRSGQPLPGFIRPSGSLEVGMEYLALKLDAAYGVVNHLLKQEPWRSMPIGRGAQLELAPVEGRIEGKPWLEYFDYYEVDRLVRLLVTACIVTIDYLTGMRPKELLGLTRGCARRVEATRTSPERLEIWGRKYKGVTDSRGNTISEGKIRDHPWWVVHEVHTAVGILERIQRRDLLLSSATLSPHHGRDDRAAAPNRVADAITQFIAWCNDAADRLDLPGNAIPRDPQKERITLRQFRQTIAEDIAQAEESPQGALIAVNRQLDHKIIATTLGYMSRPAVPGILEVQRTLARHERYSERAQELDAGSAVSGPAAQRVVGRIRRYADMFGGSRMSHRELEQAQSSGEYIVVENPHALVVCGFELDDALCLRGEGRSANAQGPELGKCEPTRCTCVARMDSQVALVREQIEKKKLQMPHVPPPMQELLAEEIRQREAIIADHERNGIRDQAKQRREVL